MKVKILKDIALTGREYRAGEVIELSEDDVEFLVSTGAVSFESIPEKSKKEHKKEDFEKVFNKLVERLSCYPITIQEIKIRYPEQYERFRELEKQMDHAWALYDFKAFTEAVTGLENIFKECSIQKITEKGV